MNSTQLQNTGTHRLLEGDVRRLDEHHHDVGEISLEGPADGKGNVTEAVDDVRLHTALELLFLKQRRSTAKNSCHSRATNRNALSHGESLYDYRSYGSLTDLIRR